eukprot:1158278-Pelagomonas_calceolata.AAC.7
MSALQGFVPACLPAAPLRHSACRRGTTHITQAVRQYKRVKYSGLQQGNGNLVIRHVTEMREGGARGEWNPNLALKQGPRRGGDSQAQGAVIRESCVHLDQVEEVMNKQQSSVLRRKPRRTR